MSPWNATASPETIYLSATALTLISFYVVILVVGLVGNVTIVVVVLAQQSQRMRNHLVMNVCAADILVCAITGSLTAAKTASPEWTLGDIWCKVATFFQSVPVAASTLGLTMLSLDRYASMKYPRLLEQQRHKMAIMVTITWSGALIFSAPDIYAHSVTDEGLCDNVWSLPILQISSVISRLVLVHLTPCIAVATCHLAVGQALCEVSLTAAAARGELPLPMPVLRRPKHVIIVAGVVNDGTSAVIPCKVGDLAGEDNSSDDDEFALQIQADINDLTRMSKQRSVSKKIHSTPNRKLTKTRRASKSERSIMKANRRLRPPAPFFSRPPLIKATAGGQSLKSRRRLTNLLILQVLVFAICWLPYVICALCVEIASREDSAIASSILPFSLLLGHAHSALNPVFYWLLNRQSLPLQGCPLLCWSWRRGESSTNLLHGLFRSQPQNIPRASSTNEAALGVFHPRYTTPRVPVPRHTSAFLQ